MIGKMCEALVGGNCKSVVRVKDRRGRLLL